MIPNFWLPIRVAMEAFSICDMVHERHDPYKVDLYNSSGFGFILRKGGTKDIPAIQYLEYEARSFYSNTPDLKFVTEFQPISAARLAAGTILIVEVSNETLGFALVESLDGMLYLANIAVRPQAARAGVGAYLLHSVSDEAVRRRLGAVTLTTFREPHWNGPWFRRHGFVSMPEAEIGSGLRAVLDRHATFLDMTKRETLRREV